MYWLLRISCLSADSLLGRYRLVGRYDEYFLQLLEILSSRKVQRTYPGSPQKSGCFKFGELWMIYQLFVGVPTAPRGGSEATPGPRSVLCGETACWSTKRGKLTRQSGRPARLPLLVVRDEPTLSLIFLSTNNSPQQNHIKSRCIKLQ